MLTKAEQICALFRTGSNVNEIVSTLECDRSYVYRMLNDSGLRTPSHTFANRFDDLPQRVNRDPCSYCNVRADIGCRHNRWAA